MEEDGLDTAHNQETIGWIALSAGTDVLGGLAYEAIITDASVTHIPHEIIFSQSFQNHSTSVVWVHPHSMDQTQHTCANHRQ